MAKLLEKRDLEDQKLNEMMSELHKKADKFRAQKKDIESRLEPFQKSLTHLRNENTMLSGELTFLNNNSTNFSQELNDLHAKSQQLAGKLQENKNIQAEIEKAFARMKEIRQDCQNALEIAKKEEEISMREISEIQARLDESKSSINEQHQRNHILNELMKAQQKRELTGIHGRLGDLGIIDERYDIAITSSCPALDNIVVSRMDDAIKAVDFLRANKIGRATFISLEKSRENSRPTPNFQAPKGTFRLFDLIKFKNEDYKPVFYSVLRDTLVCEDIDLATQVAYGAQRYRVVVTNGVVIETTGAMSGGGKPRKGGMASKVREGLSLEQITELNERKSAKMQELEDIRRKRNNVEGEIATVNKDEFQAGKEKKKYETEFEFINQQIKDIETKSKEIIKIRDSRVNDDDKKRDIEKKLLGKHGEIKKIEENLGPILEEKSIVEQKIAEIGGENLQNQQKITEEAIKNYEILEKEVSKLTMGLDATPNNLEKNEAEKTKAEKNLLETKEKVTHLKNQIESLENETLAIMGSKKAALEKKSVIEEEFKRDNQEKDNMESILNELKKTLAKYNDQIEENKQALK